MGEHQIEIPTHHAGLGLLADEGVPEDLGELAGPEGQVGPLAAQSSDALLEGEQGLVDLGPLHPGLPVGRGGVRPPLVARQIDQREFAVQRPLVVVLPQNYLGERRKMLHGIILILMDSFVSKIAQKKLIDNFFSIFTLL